MADSTQGTSRADLVLLDEWHVRAFVAPDLSDPGARALAEQISRDLRAWGAGLPERLEIAVSLRVSIER